MSNPHSTVFVVDDDPSVRRSTERLLRSAGLKVQTFSSAREFLAGHRPEGPACLVLDVRLPGRSGLDLQRELAAAGVRLPVIFKALNRCRDSRCAGVPVGGVGSELRARL